MSLAGFKSLPLPIVQLSLAAVLKCGQSFRWSINEPPNASESDIADATYMLVEYRLCLKDRVVCLRQSSDTLFYRSAYPDPQPSPTKLDEREAETLKWLSDYFQLKTDLVCLYKQWAAKDRVFASFQERFEGIRILRQDPWENLVSFICSSNNNIARITKMVQNLCKQYSSPLLSLSDPFNPSEIHDYYPFPSPSVLAVSGVGLKLRALGFGYRADYIQRTAKMLIDTHGTGIISSPASKFESNEASEVWLRKLRHMETVDARDELLKFVGVGRKVADCVLLMSLDKREVVPVDTHVHQIAVKHYGLKASTNGKKTTMTPKLYEQLNSRFYTIWGEYAGWAHTVLFTADLKSFSSYGLPTPSTSPPASSQLVKKSKKSNKFVQVAPPPLVLPIPPVKPSVSPLKRKLELEEEEHDFYDEDVPMTSISQLCEEANETLSLADRVKKRRRL